MIRIHELLVDHQPYHSNFQMDYLITRRHGGTLFACYKQSLRELERRFRALQQVCRERRDATTRDRAVEWEHHRTTEHATTSVFDDSATLVVIDTAREFL
ncbi:MAG: hypothetical protein NT069_20850, partial [Planctomycetota bacterium]|nr:hypothetical protein [Planctomycetota bacterium]